MSEKKDFNNSTNKKHLDFSSISFPDIGNDADERYNKRMKELGLDQQEFIYDEDKFNSINRLNEYQNDAIPELKYWTATDIDLSIFDSADKVPTLERLELFRYGYANRFDMTPYIKYQNEYSDDTLKTLLLSNLYHYELDEEGNIKKREDGSLIYQTLEIPDNESDREVYFDTAKEHLVSLAFGSVTENVVKDKLFSKNYTQDFIDKVIVGYYNGFDIFDDIDKIIETGVIEEIPDEETLEKMIDKKLSKKTNAIKTIDGLYNKVINSFVEQGVFEIVKARDLNLVSSKEQEEIENQEHQQEEFTDDQDDIIINEQPNPDDKQEIIIDDQDNASLNLNRGSSDQRLAYLAAQGGITPKEIAEFFDTEIDRLRLLKETILRSIK